MIEVIRFIQDGVTYETSIRISGDYPYCKKVGDP